CASVLPDYLVGHRAAALLVEIDGRAEHAATVGVEQLGIDQVGVAELRLDLRNAPFDEALLVACGVVLGVFRQIAVRPRFGDGLRFGSERKAPERVGVGTPSFACKSCSRYGSSWVMCFIPAQAALAPAMVV